MPRGLLQKKNVDNRPMSVKVMDHQQSLLSRVSHNDLLYLWFHVRETIPWFRNSRLTKQPGSEMTSRGCVCFCICWQNNKRFLLRISKDFFYSGRVVVSRVFLLSDSVCCLQLSTVKSELSSKMLSDVTGTSRTAGCGFVLLTTAPVKGTSPIEVSPTSHIRHHWKVLQKFTAVINTKHNHEIPFIVWIRP